MKFFYFHKSLKQTENCSISARWLISLLKYLFNYNYIYIDNAIELFHYSLPRSMGGPELDPITSFLVIEELSKADGSVGWCSLISSAFVWYAGSISAEVGHALFGQPPDACGAGSFRPVGEARVVQENRQPSQNPRSERPAITVAPSARVNSPGSHVEDAPENGQDLGLTPDHDQARSDQR